MLTNREALFLDKLKKWKNHQKKIDKKAIISESSYTTNQYTIFWSQPQVEQKIGIYVTEGCDLSAIFACTPLIQPRLKGSCCIFREAKMGAFRSDMLLHNYQNNYPSEIFQPVIKKLALSPDFFEINLFEKNFAVEGVNGLEQFPKSVILMTIGRDYQRHVYQHREQGFLIDPGGWWLQQSMDQVLDDLSTAKWLKDNFINLGEMTVPYFSEKFGQFIKLLQEKTQAHIIIFNLLTLDPGNLTHNYQFVKKSPKIRRIEFNLALTELSRQLNFSIVDMDRILKGYGISKMPDFVHYPQELYPVIAEEIFAILSDRNVI